MYFLVVFGERMRYIYILYFIQPDLAAAMNTFKLQRGASATGKPVRCGSIIG